MFAFNVIGNLSWQPPINMMGRYRLRENEAWEMNFSKFELENVLKKAFFSILPISYRLEQNWRIVKKCAFY